MSHTHRPRVLAALFATALALVAGCLCAPTCAQAAVAGDFDVTLAGGGDPSSSDYAYAGGVLTIKSGMNLTIRMAEGADKTDDLIVFDTGGAATATFDGVRISSAKSGSPVSVRPGTRLTLTISGENSLKTSYQSANGIYAGTDDGPAALLVPQGAAVSISGDGSLACESAAGAGIGGSGFALQDDRNAGDITISSGTITAVGGGWSAGIGGGHGGGDGGSVTITGGTVNARSSVAGAGIGGGCYHRFLDREDYGNAGTITIEGGYVSAQGAGGASGIGAGAGGAGKDGTNSVSVTGGYFADKGWTQKRVCGTDLPDGKVAIANRDSATNGTFTCQVVAGEPKDDVFLVTGGEKGTDYTFEDGVLTIISSKPMTISMNRESDAVDANGQTNSAHIEVAENVSANVTLDSVNIYNASLEVPYGGSCLSLRPGASLNLMLEGKSVLTASEDAPLPDSAEDSSAAAVYVPKGASLSIDSATMGYLYVETKFAAGIGGAAGTYTDAGSIEVKGGHLSVFVKDSLCGSAALGGGSAFFDDGIPGSVESIVISGGELDLQADAYRADVYGVESAALVGAGAAGSKGQRQGRAHVQITGGYLCLKAGQAYQELLGGGDASTVTISGGYIQSLGMVQYPCTKAIEAGSSSITGGVYQAGQPEDNAVCIAENDPTPVAKGYTLRETGIESWPYVVVKEGEEAPTYAKSTLRRTNDSMDADFCSYDGNQVTVSELVYASYGGTSAAEDDTCLVSLGGDFTRAGWHVFSVYLSSKTIDGVTYLPSKLERESFVINKATLTPSAIVSSKVEDGSAEAEIGSVTLEGIVAGETLEEGVDYEVACGEFPSADPGTYDVTVTVKLLGTEKAANYQLSTDTVTATATIYEKDSVAMTLQPSVSSVEYGDAVDLGVQVVATGEASVAGKKVVFTAEDGTELGRATTDESGFASIAYDTTEKVIPGTEPSLVTARLEDGDVSASTQITVQPRKLYVESIGAQDKDYDGTVDVKIVEDEFVMRGLLEGDELVVGADIWINAVFATVDAGQNKPLAYQVYFSPNASSTSRYYQFDSNMPALTASINKRSLTVEADDKSIVFGDDVPVYTYEVEGLLSKETQEQVFGDELPSAVCDYEVKSSTGTYEIAFEGPDELTNYTVTYVPGTLTVVASTATVEAASYNGDEATSKFTYGDTITVRATPKPTGEPAADAGATANALSLDEPTSGQMALFYGDEQVSEAVDTAEDGSYAMTYATTSKVVPAGTSELVARFVGTQDMADASAPVSVTIDAAPLTPSVVGNVAKPYDGTTAVPDDATLGIGLAGVLDVDAGDVSAAATFSFDDAAAGTKAMTATDVALSGEAASFYELSATTVTGTVDSGITKAKLTVTADDQSVVFGDAAPAAYTYVVSGLVAGETAESVFGEDMPVAICDYKAADPAGSYGIAVSGPFELANYAVSYESGTLTVATSATQVDEPVTGDAEGAPRADFTYGDTITVTATVSATGDPAPAADAEDDATPTAVLLALDEPAAAGQAALYYRPADGGEDVQLTEAQDVTGTRAELTFAYETTARLVPVTADGEKATLVVKCVGSGDMAAAEATCEVSLAAKPVSLAWFGADARTFDDTTSEVTATVAAGGLVVGDEGAVEVALSGGVEARDAGAYEVTAALVDAAGGSAASFYAIENPTARYEVAPAELDAAFFSPLAEVTYTGEEHRPEVALSADAPAHLTAVDYDVTYEDNVHAGTATATVRAHGNFAGTVTLEFEIAPAAFSFEVVAPGEAQAATEGEGVSALEVPAAAAGVNGEQVAGTLEWFLDEAMAEPVPEGWTFSAGDVTLWWRFTPDAGQADYVSEPVCGKVSVEVAALAAAGGEDGGAASGAGAAGVPAAGEPASGVAAVALAGVGALLAGGAAWLRRRSGAAR